MNLRWLAATSIACSALMAGNAHAQDYPTRAIKLIVPTAPGGPVDVLGRIVGDHLSKGVGQAVVIENRPGSGTIVGTRAVASAEPDGYTLLLGASGSLAVTPALYKNAGYNPVTDFAAVASVSQGAQLLAVTPSLPVKSVAELVAYTRANPGKLNYGSGLGTTPHIALSMFKLQTGTEIVHVPYQGASPAITDLLAGRTHMVFEAPGALLEHVRDGKLRGLAVTSAKRSVDIPDLPTMVESGYPDFQLTFWTGVVAPARTPEPVIARLNAVINASLGSAEMKKQLSKFYVEPRPGSPKEFAAFIASEVSKWAAVVQAAGIKMGSE